MKTSYLNIRVSREEKESVFNEAKKEGERMGVSLSVSEFLLLLFRRFKRGENGQQQ